MTGYKSKRTAALDKLEQAKEILLQHPQKDIEWQREQQIKAHAKLDEEGMYLVHQTASYADNLGKSIVALGKQTVADIEQLGIQPAQEPWCMKMNGCKTKCEDCPDEAALAQPAQEPWRESASDYERGFIDGMQKQAQSSVDKAVNRMTQRPWVYLTDEHIKEIVGPYGDMPIKGYTRKLFDQIEAALRSKNT